VSAPRSRQLVTLADKKNSPYNENTATDNANTPAKQLRRLKKRVALVLARSQDSAEDVCAICLSVPENGIFGVKKKKFFFKNKKFIRNSSVNTISVLNALKTGQR
jgi:hypothetical protein